MLPISRFVLALAVTSIAFGSQAPNASELARWTQQAKNITIVRDDWGIAHVHGKTDAEAVFGALYAQAEDDFPRVEANYINALGRLAEAEGADKVYQDLRMRLFMDPVRLRAQYAGSPEWLKALMQGFADGLNYYLFKHPEVKPRVIQRFEPWMALSFTEGSIGGDIERINLDALQKFYGKESVAPVISRTESPAKEPTGSNGIAIAPSNTAGRHTLLLINPHTSFFFRSELQMASNQGLNAYGAVTWGQFFIYQGFNERAGWMHTSSGVDAVDEYLETIQKQGARLYYQYGKSKRPVQTAGITIRYKRGDGFAEKKFTVYRTHHGPVIREADGKWVSIRLMQEPIKALTQSYTRTKATNYRAFRETMELKANSSNNTIFADAEGNIAYFHGNFIPRRDLRHDWTKPVDGSDPTAEWRGLLSIDETPHLLNPASGWLYNANNSPWSAAGSSSPKQASYPPYVENGGESARGVHAIRLLQNTKNFTLESLIAAAYDSYLPWFEKPREALVQAWEQCAVDNPLKAKLAEPIRLLRDWDLRWAVTSVPTSLAVFWGEEVLPRTEGGPGSGALGEAVAQLPGEQLLQSLSAAVVKLETGFGSWKTPWGDINRFQRLSGALVQPFNDAEASVPVGFTSSKWGSLASFGARPYPGTRKWYGTSGNSFVAVVEFGDQVRAKAVTAGGESGHPSSIHFNDQALRYSTGELRDVYFYPADLKQHTEREYHPGW